MSYLGRSAKLSLKAQEKVSFLATAGQTSKTGLSYVVGFVEVILNGSTLTDVTDYTATDGNSITFLGDPLTLNDEVTVVSLKTFTVADHYTQAQADALLAAKATVANFTSTGIDDNATSTAITIDASENVLVGKTSPTISTAGVELRPNGQLFATQSGNYPLLLNRTTNDGAIAEFRKDGTTVGSVMSRAGLVSTIILDPRSNGVGLTGTSNAIMPVDNTGTATNGVMDLGDAGQKFKDVILSGGVYLGGSGSSNKLDDYEEGTFTATLTTSSSNVTFSNGATFTCTYTKVGRLVTCTGYTRSKTITNTGSGTPRITGLPFTCINANEGYSVVNFSYNSMLTGSSGYVEINNTHLVCVANESTGIASYTGTGDKRLMFTISYITA